MKKLVSVLFLIVLCITFVGCNKNENDIKNNENNENNENVVSHLNCVTKDDTGTKKLMLEFNESDELDEINIELDYNWGSIYGGGTDQVYELAEKYVKEYFDSITKGLEYTYEFFKEGNAIAKAKITREQFENGEVSVVGETDMSEFFNKNKAEMKEYVHTYCTEDNSENWDIIIFDPLYEFTAIYLDYINEDANELGEVMYSWYALTKDLKVMNVVYMLDAEEGFVYSYSDYQVPTLDEEIQRLKEGNTKGVNNPTKYAKWLQSIKTSIEEEKL